MADDKIKLMEELCMTPGISSHEEKIAEIIKRELKGPHGKCIRY